MTLKPYAMNEDRSRGRKHPQDNYASNRGMYERDIDRVIHSRAFKRLAGKTQVITGRQSDHHRTRLTHSIEVGSLCRSVARQMGLNCDLAACLGFAHDLGHPPLGHCGEDVLNEICHQFGDVFEHNRHTLTIVDEFEQKYAAVPGLNLSFEVREGIVKHSEIKNPDSPDVAEFLPHLEPPVEAQMVDNCDEICYCYSDLDDALEMRYIRLEDILRELPPFDELYHEMSSQYPGALPKLLFNETLRRLMNRTVEDMVAHTAGAIAAAGIGDVDDIRRAGRRLVDYSPEMGQWMLSLKAFLNRHYYQDAHILEDRDSYMAKIRKLFEMYYSDLDRLPLRYREMIRGGDLPRHRVIVYYIAGFTDFYLFQTIKKFNL